jgi:hypothetical protein
MAQDPFLLYYPAGTTRLRKVSLGFVADLQPHDQVEAVDVRTGGASPYRHTYQRTRTVLVAKERFTSASLRRDLEALVIHLRAGGVCQFVLDIDNAIARFARPPAAGDTTLTMVSPNLMDPAGASPSHTSGDELRVESPERVLRAETVTYSSESGDVLTVSELRNEYPTGPVLVRERDAYPVLRLPAELAASTDLLTHDRRLNYTLTLPLVEYPADLWALYEAPALGSTTDLTRSPDVDSLDSALSRASYNRYNYGRSSVIDSVGRGNRFATGEGEIHGVSTSGFSPYRTDPRWLR